MSGEVILVVDDEKDLRQLIADALGELGYRCVTAGSAAEAAAALAQQRIDLALLDIMMPGRSGVELFQDITKANLDTGVVFVTAKADLNLAVDTMRTGALDYLHKPVDLDDLAQVVERALEKRQASRIMEGEKRSLEQKLSQQSQLLENRLREVAGLNKLLQSVPTARTEITDLSEKIAASALQTAELLKTLAEQIQEAAKTLDNK